MPTPVTPTPIDPPSQALPDPADLTTWPVRMAEMHRWMRENLSPGAQLIGDQAYLNALAAEESAEAALATSGALMWNAATNYATGASAISPVDYQTYRRQSPGGVNATDPSASALWVELGSKRVAKAGDTGLGPMGFNVGAHIGHANMHFAPIYKHCMFQHPGANQTTLVGAKPSGTGNSAGFFANNGSASEYLSIGMGPTGGSLTVGKDFSAFGDAYRSLFFNVGDASRVEINNTGQVKVLGTDLMVGATAYPANVTSGLYVLNGVSAGGFRSHAGTVGAFTADAWNLHWNGANMALWVSTTNVGNLTITSDYRIKRDVQPMPSGALARVARLRPITYRHTDFEALNFKAADDREREGFLAHELAEVVPSAVDGEKDEANRIQSLRLDALVALLTKALQEQQAQIEDITQQLNALRA